MSEESTKTERKKNKRSHKIEGPRKQIRRDEVDITNASKQFELQLDKLGPYRCNYYKNGRCLLIGGYKGHVAAFDWLTKDLMCEFNVRESVHAVQWLHVPNMFAVAQKEWVHIYDKDGVELNVVKSMYRSTHLEFLEHHFLLASASDKGYLAWKDISLGKDVSSFPTKNKVTSLAHDTQNGMLYCAHPNGTVTMWSPNFRKPAVSMLCHAAAVRAVSVATDGNYFATTGVDKTVRVWDLRNNYRELKHHKLQTVPDSAHVSQLGLLAIATGSELRIYKDAYDMSGPLKPYLKYDVGHTISDVYFCNYEDVLGIGHQGGFTSLLVPGSGEPNFDSHEANPFMSKSQQREMEVRMLLDKIPYEMISMDPTKIAKKRSS